MSADSAASEDTIVTAVDVAPDDASRGDDHGGDAPADASNADAVDGACPRPDPEWGRGGEFMLPGSHCLSCHSADAAARRHPFTVAGSVFQAPGCGVPAPGTTVIAVDVRGQRAVMRTNEVGNFFTSEPLDPPLQFTVEREGRSIQMPLLAPHGSCGACNGPDRFRGFVAAP